MKNLSILILGVILGLGIYYAIDMCVTNTLHSCNTQWDEQINPEYLIELDNDSIYVQPLPGNEVYRVHYTQLEETIDADNL